MQADVTSPATAIESIPTPTQVPLSIQSLVQSRMNDKPVELVIRCVSESTSHLILFDYFEERVLRTDIDKQLEEVYP